MEEFLRNLLHIPVQEQVFDKSVELPLLLTGLYDIKTFLIGEKLVYFIHPKEHIPLPNLKKHLLKLTTLLDGDSILYDDGYTRYGISKLTEMGVPFIFGDKNIYLPNMGIQIHEKPAAKWPDADCFSPFTQKLVLSALYKEWTYISGKEIAEQMNVSRMTVNRAFLELEALALPLITVEGKSKYLKNNLSREELFKLCEDFFISPIKKSVKMSTIPVEVRIKSGVSALAEYTMLGDNPYPTFAVDREQYRELAIKSADIISKDELPSCVIQIHRYLLAENGVVDPISAILSVASDELEDARIEQAVNEIKEGVFHGRWHIY